jgi:hypothetical protein
MSSVNSSSGYQEIQLHQKTGKNAHIKSNCGENGIKLLGSPHVHKLWLKVLKDFANWLQIVHIAQIGLKKNVNLQSS